MNLGLDDSFATQTAQRLAAQPSGFLNNRLRENPALAGNQAMQDYLAPLEHQARLRENIGMAPEQIVGDSVTPEGQFLPGVLAAVAAPGYDITKMVAQQSGAEGRPLRRMARDAAQWAVEGVGGGGPAITSRPGIASLMAGARGTAEGMAQLPARLQDVFGRFMEGR